MKIGSTMQTMLIHNLKKENKREPKTTDTIDIYDAPPGTSCSVVETIADANRIIVVAEPTPFGLHDFKLIIKLLRDMEKPFSVIVNKANESSNVIIEKIKDENVDVIGVIPFEKDVAKNYAVGTVANKLSENNISIFTNWVNSNYKNM